MTLEQAEGRIKELEDILEDIMEVYEEHFPLDTVSDDDAVREVLDRAEDVLYRGEAYADED